MQLRQIYKADINRTINGVIKMAQNDEESIQQELCEYVITKELRRHFSAFFNSYERSISTPTDKIGVWISGFFGSGKSHFLKMLSYLLSNKVVAGKHAVDCFELSCYEFFRLIGCFFYGLFNLYNLFCDRLNDFL